MVNMISEISCKITEKLNRIAPLSEMEKVTVQHGLDILLENVIKIIIILKIGQLNQKTVETGIFILIFTILRGFAGGTHMKTGIGCFGITLFFWFMSVYVSQYEIFKNFWLFYMGIICLPILALFAPKYTQKPVFLTKKQIYYRKIGTVFMTTVIIIFSYFYKAYREVMIFTLIIETITVINEARKGGGIIWMLHLKNVRS